MNYYLTVFHTFSDFDQETKFENFQPVDYGIEFSFFPYDDILEKDNKFFCSDRLYFKVFNKSIADSFDLLDGVEMINYVRTTKSPNFQNILPDVVTDRYLELKISGKPFENDFGLLEVEMIHEVVGKYFTKILICSEKAIRKLILNHCPHIMGLMVTRDNIYEMLQYLDEINFGNSKYWLINQINHY